MPKLWGKVQAMTQCSWRQIEAKALCPWGQGRKTYWAQDAILKPSPEGEGVSCEAGILPPEQHGHQREEGQEHPAQVQKCAQGSDGSEHRGLSAPHYEPRTCNKQPSTTGGTQEQWRRLDLAQASCSGWKLSMDTNPELKASQHPSLVPYAQGAEMTLLQEFEVLAQKK